MAAISGSYIDEGQLLASSCPPPEAQEAFGLRMDTLVLCRDEKVLQTIWPVVASTATAQLCKEPRLAIEILARWKFDAVVLDCDTGPQAMDVMRFLRLSPSNRKTVAIALVDGIPTSTAFAAGATFVLNKPVTRERARSVLCAAQGLMILGRRRSYRRPIVTPLTFVNSSRQALYLSTVNVSEGGMMVKGPRVPSQGDSGTVSLTLPEIDTPIVASVETVWSRPNHAGLRFTTIVNGGAATLRDWIRKSFEQELAATKPARQTRLL